MKPNLQDPEPAPASAAWTSLIKSSVPGLGFLLNLGSKKPWTATAWLWVLGLAVAACCGVLLRLGMQDEAVAHRNSIAVRLSPHINNNNENDNNYNNNGNNRAIMQDDGKRK